MPKFSIDYTQDINTVYDFLTDPDAIQKRCEALGETNVRVNQNESGGLKTISRVLDPLPRTVYFEGSSSCGSSCLPGGET